MTITDDKMRILRVPNGFAERLPARITGGDKGASRRLARETRPEQGMNTNKEVDA
jgi:hypothetical protein